MAGVATDRLTFGNRYGSALYGKRSISQSLRENSPTKIIPVTGFTAGIIFFVERGMPAFSQPPCIVDIMKPVGSAHGHCQAAGLVTG